ncbi:MAG TPA: methylated-DNA--[protein]-cysteine S-methyltransferase [Nocardioidaceae bacterium]|nr:methylated-DNA--[protein]-cysteine S-methyltransferase [Nocardioidaceae bacterium]
MWTTTDSPVGELRIVEQQGSVVAVDFVGPMPAEGPRTSSMVVAAARADGRPLGDRDESVPVLREAVGQLTAYFARDLKEFDLPLDPHGTDFQRRVWDQLRRIDYGQTASYGEIAARLGMTGHAARAVGLANGRNPIPVIIPCHRVVGSDGSLTGYGGGIERKQLLLDLEIDALF